MGRVRWRITLTRYFELFLLLQVLDMFTTIVGIEGAGGAEGNAMPMVAIQMYGWLGLAMLKIGAIFVGLLTFLVGIWMDPIYRGFRVPMLAVFTLVNVMGIGVVVWNTAQILSVFS